MTCKLAGGRFLVLALASLASCTNAPRAPVRLPAAALNPQADDPRSLMDLCQAVLEGRTAAQAALRAHPLVAKMSQGMQPQVSFTPEEYASAAFAREHDERFSWRRLRRNAGYLRAFLQRLDRDREGLLGESLKRATELLSVEPSPSDITVNLVCGGPWDAYVLIFEKPELFFDVGWQADQPPAQAIRDFRAILTHELWHLAFFEHQRKYWPRDYRESADPRARFLYRMLNEGIGHYYSMHHHLQPTISWPDFTLRAQRIFALLDQNYARYLAESDDAKQRDLLWRSHAGVPFWEKWGAVTGAIMVHALLQKLGHGHVKRLIASEPFSVFLAYDELTRSWASWPRLPAALIEDARRALEVHRRALR